ncbi:MAG: nitroreductase family protein [Thermodesulfobacteriota bacterium]
MEFKEVVGRRRSIRFYLFDKSVETEKVQVILEAARLAPCASNLNVLRAIVVERDKASKRLIDSIAEFNRVHILQAPILICWYVDMQAWKDRYERMKELIDVGALKPEYGWSHEYIDNVYMKTRRKDPEIINYIEGGMGIAFGMVAAVDQGLCTCLNTCDSEEARKALGLPETATVLWIMSVGYPVESPEVEKQRPRRQFEELFSLNNYRAPFKRDEKVVKELKKAKMIQP